VTAYLDHAATTPMHQEAVEAMLPFLTSRFGNPSGSHAVAREARKALEEARDLVAECLGARPGEVVFTAGGTEADNLAIAGAHAVRPGVVVCSAVEHHAVLHACEHLGGVLAPVLPSGVTDLDAFAGLLDPGVSVVSVMLANNEVGTVQPLAEVAAVVRERAPGAVLHTDAVQAFSWLDVATLAAPADLVAVSAHKFGGPKGVGALVVREGVKVAPLLRGGGQERDRRSGTHNVAGIVGMAAAMEATVSGRAATVARVGPLRDRLADGLLAAVPDSAETGDRAAKVAGNCHLSFAGVESEALLVLLDGAGVCASAGSACTSGAMEPSHVLTAMGVPRERALGSLRLTLGTTTTDADVDTALAAVPPAVARLRGSPG
jgi:cysteine desulfurase